jgi:hypothetical protein
MNYEKFAIWLHGFLEISNAEEINKNQTQIIKDHLALLFEKKTPDRSEEKFFNDPNHYIDLNTEFDRELHKNKTYC